MHFLLGLIPAIVACYLLYSESTYVFYFAVVATVIYLVSSMTIIVDAIRIFSGKTSSDKILKRLNGADLASAVSVTALIVNCTLMTVGLLLNLE